jgi:Fascin domain
MKLRVHDGFGGEDMRNLNRLYETDVAKGRYSDNIGGILIKDRSGNSLCYVTNCGGSLSAEYESWSELWLAEKIQGTTKYAFRSSFGKYLTAQNDSGIVTADKHIALAYEVWTVERLSDGSMVFKSQHGRYLGIDRNT